MFTVLPQQFRIVCKYIHHSQQLLHKAFFVYHYFSVGGQAKINKYHIVVSVDDTLKKRVYD